MQKTDRKTAEEVLNQTLIDRGLKYTSEPGNRYIGEPHVITAMHTFAEQEAVEFAEWAAKHYLFDPESKVWYGILSGDAPTYSTTQLYQIFKAKRDGE